MPYQSRIAQQGAASPALFFMLFTLSPNIPFDISILDFNYFICRITHNSSSGLLAMCASCRRFYFINAVPNAAL